MKVHKALNINGVVIYRQKIQNPHEVIEAIEWVQKVSSIRKWQPAMVTHADGSQSTSDVRSNEGLFLPPANHVSDDARESAFVDITKIIDSHFHECIADYTARFAGTIGSYSSNNGYNVLKYHQGQEYVPHTDDSPNTPRRLSGLAYLNDNYEGGELNFTRLNLRYYPMAGDIVLFPSGMPYEHAAMPVTEGIKYAVVGWWS